MDDENNNNNNNNDNDNNNKKDNDNNDDNDNDNNKAETSKMTGCGIKRVKKACYSIYHFYTAPIVKFFCHSVTHGNDTHALLLILLFVSIAVFARLSLMLTLLCTYVCYVQVLRYSNLDEEVPLYWGSYPDSYSRYTL